MHRVAGATRSSSSESCHWLVNCDCTDERVPRSLKCISTDRKACTKFLNCNYAEFWGNNNLLICCWVFFVTFIE